MDSPPQQVAREVKVLEIDADYAKKLGIDWASIPSVISSVPIRVSGTVSEKISESESEKYRYEDFSDTSLSWREETFSSSTAYPAVVIGGGATVYPEKLWEIIEQSIHEGRGRVISSTRIIVQNNHPGTLWAGEGIYYAFYTSETSSGRVSYGWGGVSGDISQRSTIKRGRIPTGIMLSVTPHIGNEGMVALDINCEVSSLTGWDPQGNPLVSGREMRTTMMVKSGNTFVLGGLEKSAVIKSEKKIPILGSIPLLGYFFKKKVDAEIKKEVVIFITPTIVSSTQDMKQEMEKIMEE